MVSCFFLCMDAHFILYSLPAEIWNKPVSVMTVRIKWDIKRFFPVVE